MRSKNSYFDYPGERHNHVVVLGALSLSFEHRPTCHCLAEEGGLEYVRSGEHWGEERALILMEAGSGRIVVFLTGCIRLSLRHVER